MTLRTRTRGSITSQSQRYTEVRANGTTAIDVQQTGYGILKVGEYQTTTDVVTPRFHTRVTRGEIINNPFSSWTYRYAPQFGGYIVTRPGAVGTDVKTFTGQYVYGDAGDHSEMYVDIDQQLNEVSTEVAAKVAETNVDGAIEALEARQTMELFDLRQMSLRNQIQKELKYAERRGFRFPGSVPIAVLSNNWLKYRYGIGPAISLLHDTIVVGTKIQTRRETARDGTATGGSSTKAHTVQGGLLRVDYTINRTWESSIRAGILYEYMNFRNKYGFSIDQIPYAAWNLVPYSFVADWFWNTGTFIRALTPKAGIRQLATWMGYETKIKHVVAISSTTVMTPTIFTLTKAPSGMTTIEGEGRHRVPLIRAPSLYIRENALSEVVTSKRVVDAFALTSQMFFRLMRASR